MAESTPTTSLQALRRELEQRRQRALGMGGVAKLNARRAQGRLNARERLDLLFDAGSFHEVGMFARSARPQDREVTPADGKITGYGLVSGRTVAAVANDLTVKGASSALINGRKVAHIKRVAASNGMPVVFLGESSGSRMPDSMGAAAMGSGGQDPTQYVRMRDTPWVSAILGPSFGSSVWYAALSDFVVMRKGAIMAVSSAKVTSFAVSQSVDAEELGGWQLHSEVTGLVDAVVDSDEEAITAVRRFLSYLPSHADEPPPDGDFESGAAPDPDRILDIVPLERSRVYDVRKLIQAIVDRDSYFPIKDRFGRAVTACLARLGGKTVGVLASNPMFKAGALDPDACEKATSFLVLCDSFNIPIVLLADTPGFLIGVEGERRKAPGKIMNFMQAIQMCSVPKLTVITRKLYGQAYLNFGGGRNSDEIAAWTTADVSFMDPVIGTYVVHGVRPTDDASSFQEKLRTMQAESSPYEIAGVFGVQDVIDPRDTRTWLIEALAYNRRARGNGVGKRLMRGWPTTF